MCGNWRVPLVCASHRVTLLMLTRLMALVIRPKMVCNLIGSLSVPQITNTNDFSILTESFASDNQLQRTFSQSTAKMEDKKLSKEKRIVILRHGERVDLVFGNQWTNYSFNNQNYVRMDLNMPESLPPRPAEDWEKDSPLTSMGLYQAKLVGSSLKSFGVNFSKVFVSPSYRCCSTANEVLSGMGLENELPLNIEYGLFEWCGWYERGLPNWLSEREHAVLFNVNEHYRPIMERSYVESCAKESLEQFYDRNATTMRELAKHSDGDILIVAHATNLETCSRQLVGKEPRSRNDLKGLLMRIPYLAAVAMQKNTDGSYQLIEPPCLTLSHNSCPKFDWKILD